ncbi:Glycosyltransferase [Tenacibaculum sp. 190524A02b]|uniref:glycosyltransferase family 4 protein n=1 Tax=Tenacibaculum vairaonense TaxID=3137860 RepID=UPI0032B27C19
MRIGIDASNVGSGGGVTHLKEILNNLPEEEWIESVILFASQQVLDKLPNSNKIIKKTYSEFNKKIIHRLWFQIFKYDNEVKRYCDILLAVTGDYIGNFKPLIGMSRNMLLYERDIWKEINSKKEVIRFWLNFKKQKKSFKNSEGIIFISQYAKKRVNEVLNITNKNQVLIHHGVSPKFKGIINSQEFVGNYDNSRPFNFIYVSSIHVYKYQWNVVKAISNLRKKGFPVKLTLIGGSIFKPAEDLLIKTIKEVDSNGEFISYLGHLVYENIEKEYKKADGIIFASTCENMPNILIESMSSALPIACSSKAPMPEFLDSGGFYFEPKLVQSIENSLVKLLNSPKERELMIKENLERIKKYSWNKTAEETFSFIRDTYNKFKNVEK